MSCAEEYDHGCHDCLDYDCPYRDSWWTDPMDDAYTKKEDSEK